MAKELSHYGSNLALILWLSTAVICCFVTIILLLHWLFIIFPEINCIARNQNKQKPIPVSNASKLSTYKTDSKLSSTKNNQLAPNNDPKHFAFPTASNMDTLDINIDTGNINNIDLMPQSPSGTPCNSQPTTPRSARGDHKKEITDTQNESKSSRGSKSNKKVNKFQTKSLKIKKSTLRSSMDSRIIIFTTMALIIGFGFELSSVIMSISVIYGIQINCAEQSYRSVMVVVERWCLYIYFLIRLKLILRDTMYEYNNLKLVAGLLTFFQFITLIFYLVYNIYYDCHKDRIVEAMIPMVGVDIIIAIILLLLFLYKMCKFIKMLIIKTDDVQGSNSSLVYLSTKLTICALVSIISSLLLLLVYPIILFSAPMIDIAINSLCLLLSFKMYDKQYRIFCGLCRLCCEKKKM